MSEGAKAIDRDEVAARRAALTDGRWRNREGIGMYQRSTSNALRDILSGVRGAVPSLSRAKSKSRSRSHSPTKRSSPAKRSPTKRTPKRSPTKRAGSLTEASIEAPEASSSKLPPIPSPSPAPTPEFESTPAKFPDTSATISSESNPSPVRPSPKAKPKRKAEAKKATKAKPKSTSKLKLHDGGGNPKDKSSTSSLGQSMVPEPELDEEPPLDEVVEDVEGGNGEEGFVRVAPESPAMRPKEAGGSRTDDSVIVFEDSVVVLEEPELEPEPQPKAPKAKVKSRIQTIVPEPVQRTTQKASKSRTVSGSKRPAPDEGGGEDETSDEGPLEKTGASAAKRAKSDKRKGKSKAPAKKGKSRKPAAKSKAAASKPKQLKTRATSSLPETSGSNDLAYQTTPTSPTPAPQDIMVPLQDSPPSRPKEKGKRRRYTLMPVRTTEEMSHPDFDPLDCIGWQ